MIWRDPPRKSRESLAAKHSPANHPNIGTSNSNCKEMRQQSPHRSHKAFRFLRSVPEGGHNLG